MNITDKLEQLQATLVSRRNGQPGSSPVGVLIDYKAAMALIDAAKAVATYVSRGLRCGHAPESRVYYCGICELTKANAKLAEIES